MKLTVFRVSYETILLLIELAQSRGNEMVAYARNPDGISANQAGPTFLQGKLSDSATLGRANHRPDVAEPYHTK